MHAADLKSTALSSCVDRDGCLVVDAAEKEAADAPDASLSRCKTSNSHLLPSDFAVALSSSEDIKEQRTESSPRLSNARSAQPLMELWRPADILNQ